MGSSTSLPNAKSKSKLAFNIDENDIQTVMGYVHRGLEKVATSSFTDIVTKEQNNNESRVEKEEDGEEEKMQPALFPPGEW